MKQVRRRNLHDTPTLRFRNDISDPASRAQAVGRFAALENERTRLLRELDTWVARKDAIERKLAALETELAGLKRALLGEPAVPASRVREQADFRSAEIRAAALLEY